jgi:hypothetical protein
LGFILQEEVTLALIYHLVEFGSIWESSYSRGSNPWSSQSSTGCTSSLRVRPNPSFVLKRSSCIVEWPGLLHASSHIHSNYRETYGISIITPHPRGKVAIKRTEKAFEAVLRDAFSLWEAYFVFPGAFCSSSYSYLKAI